MKKSGFIVLFLSLAFFAEAQLRIPADVTDAFISRYPHAMHIAWTDKLHHFEANFQLNGVTIIANFSSKGEWQGSERELGFNELPDEVKDGFLKSKYAERQRNTICEVQELGKPLQYRISVWKSSLQKKNLYFDVNGKLLKESIDL